LDHQDQSLVIVVDPFGHRGWFRAQLDGRVLVASSRTPFFDAARVLLAEGVEPAIQIVMRHVGSATDALTGTVGGAAKLTVEGGDRLHFRRWRPSQHSPPTKNCDLTTAPASHERILIKSEEKPTLHTMGNAP
jgi:hypothetical protein